MKIKPIKTEKDYEEALQRLEKIFDAKPNSPEDELEVLSILIDQYEQLNYPIDLDPIEAIKQMGYTMISPG
jgi:HTH-type transcriptional regulator/antitoxin HigA